MQLTARKTTAAIAAVATAGFSSLFMGVGAASAATPECGTDGTLVSPGICEQTFTESGTFTHTASMTKLEVLLVGKGGVGAQNSTKGYAAGGGGGEVRIVDFSAATDDLVITVPTTNADPTEVSSGALDETASGGVNGEPSFPTGGASGNGNLGASGPALSAGGGADGAVDYTTGAQNGGAGVVVSALVAADPALAGSLFTDDALCYGGGGAVGQPGTPEVPAVAPDPAATPPVAGSPEIPAVPPVAGTPGCNAGGPNEDSTTLNAPIPGFGGGGGAIVGVNDTESQSGGQGVVVVRWALPKPALAATGLVLNSTEVAVAGGALLSGAFLALVAYRRKRAAE